MAIYRLKNLAQKQEFYVFWTIHIDGPKHKLSLAILREPEWGPSIWWAIEIWAGLTVHSIQQEARMQPVQSTD